MRFLGIGDYCDLAALYLRLFEEGNEVKVSIANPLCRGTLGGLVEQGRIGAVNWSGSAGVMVLYYSRTSRRREELRRAARRIAPRGH
jgi:phosphoribosylamine--glycine ligase